MNNLYTGKTVIIDDRKEEVEGLITALSKADIGHSYFSGRLTGLPNKPLQGVRLLFLDLRLEGVPETFETEDLIKSLIPVIEKIIGENNGPYIVVGWTNNPTEFDAFINRLSFKPIISFDMDKAECINSKNPVETIQKKLIKKLNEYSEFKLLLFWENFIKKAANLTLNKLFEETQNREEIQRLISSITKAKLGKNVNVSNSVEKNRAFLLAMNDLLNDSTNNVINLENLNQFGDIKPVNNEPRDYLYKLNSSLLISAHQSKKFQPGNVYLAYNSLGKKLCNELLVEKIDENKIRVNVEKMLKKRPNWQRLGNPSRRGLITKAKNKKIDELKNNIKHIMVEVTPICDYAQQNIKANRLITGLLIPIDYINDKSISSVRSNSSYYLSNPFYLNYIDSNCRILLNYRGLITTSKSSLKSKKAIFTLNKFFLFEIQHNVAQHISRPALMTVI